MEKRFFKVFFYPLRAKSLVISGFMNSKFETLSYETVLKTAWKSDRVRIREVALKAIRVVGL